MKTQYQYNTADAEAQDPPPASDDTVPPILNPTCWKHGPNGSRIFETDGGDCFTLLREVITSKKGKETVDWALRHARAGYQQGTLYQLGQYESFEEVLECEAERLTRLVEEAAPPVTDLAGVLDRMVEEIKRHTVLDPHYAEAVALWVLHAHGIDACQFSPRLHIRSPVENCGKSTLLEIVEAFCKVRGAKIISSITPASYFRSIHQVTIAGGQPPIMLLDERDAFLNDESRKDAFSILNSGHKRKGAFVSRCDLSASGPYEANDYSTWAPCALAGIGGFGTSHQANALESRCININLKRKQEGEHCDVLNRESEARCVKLGRQAAAWCQKNVERLWDEYPGTPGLCNREADSWRMLFKFADAAGGRWPELARQTALAIKHGVSDDPGEGVMLLTDIKTAFEKTGVDRLTTSSLLDELHNCVERPWGKKSLVDVNPTFQALQLAAALRPYGIKAKQLRIGNENRRGFTHNQFEDAWSRYLPREAEEDVAGAKAA